MCRKIILLLNMLFLISCVPGGGEVELDEDFFKSKESNNRVNVLNTGALKIRLGNRYFVSSFLDEIYNCPKLTKKIKNNAQVFGGVCDRYNRDDCSLVGLDSQQSFTLSSTIRSGVTTAVCESLNSDDSCVGNLLNRFNLSLSSDYDKVNIEKVFNAFYPTKALPNEFFKNVTKYRTIASVDKENKDEESWKLLTLTLCLSPEWQIP